MTLEEENALQDKAISNFNSVAANARTPGYGAPGSTPQTDATNLATADAMSRSDLGNRYGFGSAQYQLGVDAPDDVLRARRDPSELIDNAITQRRNLILQGVDPDRPALYVSPERKKELLHENAVLTSQAHDEASTRISMQAQQYRQHKDIQSADDLTAMLHDLSKVQTQVGTPEHENELLQIGANHPHALTTPEGREIFMGHTRAHDSAAKLSAHANLFDSPDDLLAKYPNSEYRQDPGSGKFYVFLGGKTQKAGKPVVDPLEKELQASHGLTKENLLNPIRIRGGKLDENGEFTNQYTGAEAGPMVEISTGKGKQTVLMPSDEYHRYIEAFGANPAEGIQKAGAATEAKPDLKALAQKALDDPNADEKHKAAARKLLGK